MSTNGQPLRSLAPAEADPAGERFTFEAGATKQVRDWGHIVELAVGQFWAPTHDLNDEASFSLRLTSGLRLASRSPPR